MRRSHAWALLAVVAVSALATGTGGFSAAALDRGVAVAVAPHEAAFVSVWDPGAGGRGPEPPAFAGEDPVGDGRTKVLVVKNRLPGRTLDLRVSDRGDGPVTVRGRYDGLAPGGVAPVRAAVDCGDRHGPVSVPLRLEATAASGSFSASIPYRATVVCPAPPSDPAPAAAANASSTPS